MVALKTVLMVSSVASEICIIKHDNVSNQSGNNKF